MKQKLDFIIFEDDFKRIVFRFYPRRSHCHSFNNNPPKTWQDVYKVYYCYSIFEQYKKRTNADGISYHTETLFESMVDECSVINRVAYCCKQLASGKRVITETNSKGENVIAQLVNRELSPFGNGVSWYIKETPSQFVFFLFNEINQGCRFYLDEEKLNSFGEFLDLCCEYMLAHGEPI